MYDKTNACKWDSWQIICEETAETRNFLATRLRLQMNTIKSNNNVYKNSFIFFLLFTCTLFVVFSWGLMTSSETKEESIFIEEIKPSSFFFSIPDQIRINKPLNGNMVKQICKDLFRSTPPNQAFLNEMLKKIHIERLKYPRNADLANLQARILWYKVHLANVDDFDTSWLRKWRSISKNLWQIAQREYQKTPHSHIKVHLKEWMPERNFQHYNGITTLEYNEKFPASNDVEYLERHAFISEFSTGRP